MKYLPAWIAVASALIASPVAADETSIIPADAVVEVVSTGDYRFVEGPALAPDGSIYFSDIPQNSIHRYDPATGETTLFTDDSGGANGLMFIGGYLYACAGKAREVHIYTGGYDENGVWKGMDDRPVAHRVKLYNESRFNSPNDIAHTNDAAFFTDPRYGSREGLELPTEAVFALTDSGAREQFAVTRVIDDLVRPNGIGVSPDEQTLYVNDNGDMKIWAYPILESNKLGEARLLNDLADLGGPDGMTVGPRGRIYTTIYGQGVLILSSDGERLGFIETGPQTTNCAFGADGKTLYVTAEKSLKRVVLNTGVE